MTIDSLPPEGGLAPIDRIRADWSLFVIISGPGGVGKGTCIQRILSEMPELELIPSATTRGPDQRDGEGEYYYATETEFVDFWEGGELIEAQQVHGSDWYGQMMPGQGALGISDIDVLGSERLFEAGLPKLLRLGLLPPGNSMDEMIEVCVQRMMGRGSDQKTINRRRERAEFEIHTIQERWGRDPDAQVIVNNDLDETVATIVGLIRRQRTLSIP